MPLSQQLHHYNMGVNPIQICIKTTQAYYQKLFIEKNRATYFLQLGHDIIIVITVKYFQYWSCLFTSIILKKKSKSLAFM